MKHKRKRKETQSGGEAQSSVWFRLFYREFILPLTVLLNQGKQKRLWPPLFLELAFAVSMCVAYYFLVLPYAIGIPNNSTNFWVFSSCSLSNYHFEQIGDVWRGRLLGVLFSGYLFDFLPNGNSLNTAAYNIVFGMFQGVWLFLLFLVVILTLRHSLLINLGIFAGLMYNFSPISGQYVYPWDIPATLFFTLGILFYARRQFWQMILAICIGSFFKETVLVCALLLFFIGDWKWWKRLLIFIGIGMVYSIEKKILVGHLHLQVAALSMNNAKGFTELFECKMLIANIKHIFTPTINHVFFANAGTIVLILALGWRRRFLPYMLVLAAFLAGQFMYGGFQEVRIFMQILPLSMIILAERWQDYTLQATTIGQTVTKPADSKSESLNPILPALPWGGRETFPILTLLLVLLAGISIAIPGWQYYSIIENRRPDHQARVVQSLLSKAEKGDATAQFQLAKHYLSGQGTPANPTNAFRWFSKAAEQGIAEAQCQLGVRYVQGEGTAKDYSASIPWFRKAAAQGNVDAQYNLGLLYENGLGVKQDLAEAAIWYQRAGEKGNVLAQNSLGLICFNLRKDYAEAAQWLRKASEQGNAPAQNSLGVLYLNGLGVKQDANEALKWFQKSGEQGFVEAQNNCGLIYYNAQRLSDSAQWFRKAAEQGHAQAQFNLAQFYQKGIGYPQDPGEAYLWYERAAKQGFGLAQFALGKMYHEGQWVKADNMEAYKWFKLAQLKGVAEAEKELADCATAMTKQQINTAENEVKQSQNGRP